MGINNENVDRLEKIISKLRANEELINNSEKGSIEINYAGNNVVVSIKVVV